MDIETIQKSNLEETNSFPRDDSVDLVVHHLHQFLLRGTSLLLLLHHKRKLLQFEALLTCSILFLIISPNRHQLQ